MKRPLPFGKYLLLERINVGGMAEVFCAKAFGVEGFERILAIKKILPTMVEDDEFIQMFIDEARISVLLNHASIVQIHELGQHDENYYIAMEYVSGKDLRAILERYRRRKEIMPTAQAVYVASRICDGLDYAHCKKDARGADLNIVHRDVSPQNILISYEGDVKIIDFGIAKAANRAQKTQAGILKGKFGYMSPEQVRGLPIDRRSDVFALGVILYEMLTGERLFVGESDFSTLEKVRNAEVVPPREYNSTIPVALEKVVLQALAREVEDRYQWASDLQEALMRFLLAGDAIYSAKHLSAFMKESFAEDLAREQERMERFAQIQRPDQVEASGVTASPPKTKARSPSGSQYTDSPTDPEGTGSAEQPVPPDASDKTEIFDANALNALTPDVAKAPRRPSLPSTPAFATRPGRSSGRLPAVEVADGGTQVSADPGFDGGSAATDSGPRGETVSVPSVEVAPTVIGARAYRADGAKGDDEEQTGPPIGVGDELGEASDEEGGDGAEGPEGLDPGATQIAGNVRARSNGASLDVPGKRMAPIAVATGEPFDFALLLQKPYLYILGAALGVVLIAIIAALALVLRKPKPGLLMVRASPEDAAIVVDNTPISQGRVSVMPGRHSITVSAPNYVPIRGKVVQVEPGEVKIETVALAPEAVPEAPAPAPPAAEPPPAAPAPEAPSAAPAAAPTPAPVATAAPVPTPAPVAAPTEPEVPAPPPARAAKKFKASFQSDPPGADVRVAGRTMRTPATLDLDGSRSYQAKFFLKGYRAETLPVKDDGSGEVPVIATLTKLPEAPAREAPVRRPPKGGRCKGSLITSANPVAEVLVDGKTTGRWTPIPPASALELDAAEHVIGYRTADGKTTKKSVTIRCGEQSKLLGVNDFK